MNIWLLGDDKKVPLGVFYMHSFVEYVFQPKMDRLKKLFGPFLMCCDTFYSKVSSAASNNFLFPTSCLFMGLEWFLGRSGGEVYKANPQSGNNAMLVALKGSSSFRIE